MSAARKRLAVVAPRMAGPPQRLTAPVEDYLKAIYAIELGGWLAATNDIAQRLGIAPASVTGMIKKLAEDHKDKFYNDIRKDLLSLQNSSDMNISEDGVAKQVQFSYEFYFDGLTKTKMYEGLLLNHRTLLYIVTRFNDKFGIPVLPSSKSESP